MKKSFVLYLKVKKLEKKKFLQKQIVPKRTKLPFSLKRKVKFYRKGAWRLKLSLDMKTKKDIYNYSWDFITRFPRMNCFTFINKMVGEIMAISFIPKKIFNPLKSLLRKFYSQIKKESPKYRNRAYFFRCFYRKNNRTTVFFKRYWLKPRLNIVFMEHSRRQKFSFFLRKKKLKFTYTKKTVLRKFFSKYYSMTSGQLKILHKTSKTLKHFISNFEYRLDFLLVNLGFIRNLKVARNMVKGGYICVNFLICRNPSQTLKPTDLIWVLRSPWDTYLIENSEDSIYEHLYNLVHYTKMINLFHANKRFYITQKPMHSINSYFFFLSVFSKDLSFIQFNSYHSPQKPFQNIKIIDSFINNKLFW